MSSSAEPTAPLPSQLSLPWLTHLNTLCVLEATVGLAWQAVLANRAEVVLNPAQRIVLVLSLWLGYAADRWLDVRRLPRPLPEDALTERHRFFARHPQRLAYLWVVVCVGDLAIALRYLAWEELAAGCFVMVAAAAYLAFAQAPKKAKRWLRKEPLTASVFVLGASLFSWSWRWDLELHTMQLALVTLATINLLAVSHREREVDLLPFAGQHGSVVPQSSGENSHEATWPVLLTLVLLFTWFMSPTDISVIWATVSALLSGALVTQTAQRHIESSTTHALLDIVLLLPALPLLY